MMKKELKKTGIPRMKKKVNAFLVGEEGKISKQSLLKVGAILSSVALGSVLSSNGAVAEHSNSLTLNYGTGTATATHGHHSSHSSHSSHSQHDSHSSHNNCTHFKA